MRRARDPHGPSCCCYSCCTQWQRGDLIDDEPETVDCVVVTPPLLPAALGDAMDGEVRHA